MDKNITVIKKSTQIPHARGKDREINDIKVMTEQGTHERVLIRVDILHFLLKQKQNQL